ncbi:MAG: GNAT family N-acetyltransferase [Betaproteobacteria bacterium]
MTLARALFDEYARWLRVDLCFQGFDEELRTLPGAYAPPRGRLLLAGGDADAFACIALRPLAQPAVGEVKRLYVQPAHRGKGWGGRLVAALLAEARAIGYDELKLDTLDWMNAARALYEETGFRACAPYYANPLPGVVYMSLHLCDADGG